MLCGPCIPEGGHQTRAGKSRQSCPAHQLMLGHAWIEARDGSRMLSALDTRFSDPASLLLPSYKSA